MVGLQAQHFERQLVAVVEFQVALEPVLTLLVARVPDEQDRVRVGQVQQHALARGFGAQQRANLKPAVDLLLQTLVHGVVVEPVMMDALK